MTAAIRLNRRGSWLTASMIRPVVLLDGRPVVTSFGSTVLPVAPGSHRLDVREGTLVNGGFVSLLVAVAPGRLVDVEYAPSRWSGRRGRLGFGGQERPDRTGATVSYVLAAAFLGVPVIAVALWGLVSLLAR
ncbi:hypothetical protein [Tsukamurella pseudospumae]|uniref:Uncharacterized protein n=1 Tax=Tsukamurella pseudospumae TaxID=239498 RepID=A0A138ANX5_9ACTN|nr:hypothetical protein [Tsukamurella pseudospumae]KXP00927.1 hypothetical protein AXK61_13060 [Tsukamurella pseudospumae]KXP12153.1 hypothetical protein AXK60_24150 [Tsukamurella pseudospumae]